MRVNANRDSVIFSDRDKQFDIDVLIETGFEPDCRAGALGICPVTAYPLPCNSCVDSSNSSIVFRAGFSVVAGNPQQ